ncbi:MAG: vWA domain-containing protein [Panacagrimonas sp.]
MDLSSIVQDFHFLRPAWLAALLPVCLLAGWLARRRGRVGHWAQLIDPELLPALQLEGTTGTARAASPWVWLALAWTLAVLALAGPAWQRDVTAAFRAPAAWVLVLDLSPSMAAADLAPNRVTRARYALDDLLGAARDARVGLVVFSGEPFTVTPLTDDVTTVRALLTPLAPDLMPAPGDQLAPALARAGELLRQAGSRNARVIVFTDGFADPAAAFTAAGKLKEAGVSLSVVGIGTQGGAPQPQAGGGFAKDVGGQTRLARLDSDLLHALASAGNGSYVDLPNLRSLVDELQAREERRSGGGAAAASEIEISRWRDAGVWLLPVLLMLAALLSRRGWL